MYATSQDYKDRINSLYRTFKLDVRIEHSTGTLVLEDENIVQGSFNVNGSSQSGDEFNIGGTVGSDMEISILKIPEYDNIDFIGAKIVPTVGILITESIDGEEEWEYVPLGQFNIDVADKTRSTINIRAIDNMIFLDRMYDMSSLMFPLNLKNIYLNLCSNAGVTPNTINFINDDYIVKEKPVGEFSYRNILGFVAELSGSFASFNRNGSLELKWYEETGVEITPDQRSKLEIANTPDVQITGISIENVVPKKIGVDEETGEDIFEDENVTYLAGTETYVLDLTDNPLLRDNYEVVLNNILTKVSTVKFRPYTSDYSGNPALEYGDIITQIDIDGNIFKTVITHSKYKYRGTCNIEAKAISNVMRGFKSTDNRIVSIIKRVEENLGDKISEIQQAQISGTEMIANTLGGYMTNIKYESDPNYPKFKKGIFIHDSINLATSTKIWKWSLGGFGFSDDGGLTFTTGITADNSIYANLITANMIQTGILRSLNGKSLIDLDNGTLLLGNNTEDYSLWWDGENLKLGDGTLGDIKGEQGIPGTRGEDGYTPIKGIDYRDGIDGKAEHIHQRYSSNGTEFTGNGGRDIGSWIGTLINESPIASTNFDDYTWVKFVGADGKSKYTYIAWADSATGNLNFTTTDPDRLYVGIYVSDFPTQSTDQNDYKWSRIKGDAGSSLYVQYSINGADNWHDDLRLSDVYMRQKIGVTGNWTVGTKIVAVDGEDGEDGSPGSNGDSVEIQYSADSIDWHAAFLSGDKYIRQRIGSGTWSNSIKIVGEDANLLDWVQDWDNNKTRIGANNFVTPKLFAGTKDSDGKITGTFMGTDPLNYHDGIVSYVDDRVTNIINAAEVYFRTERFNLELTDSNDDVKASLTAQDQGFQNLYVESLRSPSVLNKWLPASKHIHIDNINGNDGDWGTPSTPVQTFDGAIALLGGAKYLDQNVEFHIKNEYRQAFEIRGFSGPGRLIINWNNHKVTGILFYRGNTNTIINTNINMSYEGSEDIDAPLIVDNCSHVRFMTGKISGSNKANIAIWAQGGSNVYCVSMQVNHTKSDGFRADFGSNMTVIACAGYVPRYAVFANNGSRIGIATSIPSGGSANSISSNGSMIVGTAVQDAGITIPPTSTNPPKTVEITGSSLNSYNTSKGFWETSRPDTLLQGTWSSYGPYKGLIGFNLTPIRNKTITAMSITITRTGDSGSSGPINLHLGTHAYSSRPAGNPTISNSLNVGSLRWGETKTFNLPASWRTLASNSGLYGFGISGSGYARIKGSAVLKVTYN